MAVVKVKRISRHFACFAAVCGTTAITQFLPKTIPSYRRQKKTVLALRCAHLLKMGSTGSGLLSNQTCSSVDIVGVEIGWRKGGHDASLIS